jgi:6-phosphogluconate dehydrogenase
MCGENPLQVSLPFIHRGANPSPCQSIAVKGNPWKTWQPVRMQIGMVGLGRMGANMVRRLQRDGHECVAYDVTDAAVAAMEAEGARGARTPQELVDALTPPRHLWLMVPAAYVASTIAVFEPLLAAGDTLVDGGNSWYRDDIDRSGPLAAKGIHYLDVGTSGGVFGLDRGYCLMVGGATDAVQQLAPVFDSLAPGMAVAARTEGRTGEPIAAERGWLHCGPSGAGHFVKMVHNGIEYGMMASYAEGLNVLANAGIGSESHAKDAETAPLTHPEYYQYDLDLASITEVWRRGSVVSSWLLDLTAAALHADPALAAFEGTVSDSGEGRWTLHAAIDEGVPVPTLAASLFDRWYSRDRGDVAHKVLSAMRAGFGGHHEVAK